MAEAAEQLVAETSWLPEPLRIRSAPELATPEAQVKRGRIRLDDFPDRQKQAPVLRGEEPKAIALVECRCVVVLGTAADRKISQRAGCSGVFMSGLEPSLRSRMA